MLNSSFYLRQLLGEGNLETIQQLLSEGNFSKSKDELIEYYPGYQTNSEMVPSVARQAISAEVMKAITADRGFSDLVFPQQSTNVIVSKTEVGEGLMIHHDNAGVGEFSTTVFLSDPDTYEGGELSLWIDGVEKKFRPPAGWAVTYTTGIPHGVMPVTKGCRLVAVFWTKSLIKDPRHREILSGLRRLRKSLPAVKTFDFDEAVNDPEFILLGLENKYIRYFLQ